MSSIRQEQVASLLKLHLGDLFIKNGRNYYGGAFVTITNIRVTSDLMIARIYLSIFNVQEKQDVVDLMESQNYLIRKDLGKKIRNKVRRIPNIEFYLDDTLDEVDRLEKVFENLNITKPVEEEGAENEEDTTDEEE